MSICYILTCAASDHKPCNWSFWIFSMGMIATCCIGLFLSLCRPLAYAKARLALLIAMWYLVPATTLDTHVVLERALRDDKQPLPVFLLIAAVKLPIMVQLLCSIRVKIAWAPMVHLVGALIFYIATLRGAALYEGSVSQQPWVQFLTTTLNTVLCTIVDHIPGVWRHEESPPLPSLSPRETLMLLWLLLQGSIFAAGFVYQASAESRDRRRFLDEAGLHAEISTAPIGELAARLAAVYVSATLWMHSNVHYLQFLPSSSCQS
eukprot:jgi/Botrbrau1/19227/Bobra.0077s0126.3